MQNHSLDIRILEKEGFLDKVILYKDDKLISQYKYDKEINYKGKAYMIKYRNNIWFVLYSTPKFLGSTTLIRNDGLLIYLNTLNISIFPGWQSTNSLLCFTYYDMDGELDYMQFKAGVKNEVNFFHLDKTCFTLDKRFRLKMATIDNRAYFLDTLKSTLPVRYHTYKALPGNMK